MEFICPKLTMVGCLGKTILQNFNYISTNADFFHILIFEICFSNLTHMAVFAKEVICMLERPGASFKIFCDNLGRLNLFNDP